MAIRVLCAINTAVVMNARIAAWSEKVAADVDRLRRAGDRIAFVAGKFDIVHPGHLRLLNFAAECSDRLVVGVYADGVDNNHLPEQLRLEGIRSIGVVDYAFILPELPDRIIRRLRPHVVVKGKEYESAFNPEQNAVDSYGGSLLFSSGEARFSSLDLLRREIHVSETTAIHKPLDYLRRHDFTLGDLAATIRRFAALTVLVIGDLIVDEYISCDALGMSQEDPTLVVSPFAQDRFVGGAGIVAAHASGLGARVRYLGVTGTDTAATAAADMLERYNVDFDLLRDPSRPTTLKQRYRVGTKTLLRVSHLRQHDISPDLADQLLMKAVAALDGTDLVIFSDFNYGVLPQGLVDRLTEACQERGIMMVADSQASSQMSDVSRYRGMSLLTPTEREARLAMRDSRAGLVVLADELLHKANAGHVLVTLGAEGLLIHSPRSGGPVVTDRLPAFNAAPRDVAGAGDAVLTCSAMALAAGSTIWQGAYLGAVAAACQVSRIGNAPLSAQQIMAELSR